MFPSLVSSIPFASNPPGGFVSTDTDSNSGALALDIVIGVVSRQAAVIDTEWVKCYGCEDRFMEGQRQAVPSQTSSVVVSTTNKRLVGMGTFWVISEYYLPDRSATCNWSGRRKQGRRCCFHPVPNSTVLHRSVRGFAANTARLRRLISVHVIHSPNCLQRAIQSHDRRKCYWSCANDPYPCPPPLELRFHLRTLPKILKWFACPYQHSFAHGLSTHQRIFQLSRSPRSFGLLV